MLSADLTAKEWNDHLLEKYGYGLWEFANALTGTLYYRGYKYFYSAEKKKKIKPSVTKFPRLLNLNRAYYNVLHQESFKDLENLKSYIIQVLVEECKKYGWFADENKISERTSQTITEIFDLKPFFKKLTHYLQDIRYLEISNPLQNKKGPPIKPIYLVAFLWSEVMKDKKGRQWSKILYLLKWFSQRLKTSKYGQEYLNIPDNITQKNLKREFMVDLKRNNKSKERCEFLEKERSIYFPIEKNHKRFQIKFKDQFINIDPLKNRPLLIFPDGIQFPEKRRRPVLSKKQFLL